MLQLGQIGYLADEDQLSESFDTDKEDELSVVKHFIVVADLLGRPE